MYMSESTFLALFLEWLPLFASAFLSLLLISLFQRWAIFKSGAAIQEYFSQKMEGFVEELSGEFPPLALLFRGKLREKVEGKIQSYFQKEIPVLQSVLSQKMLSLSKLILFALLVSFICLLIKIIIAYIHLS